MNRKPIKILNQREIDEIIIYIPLYRQKSIADRYGITKRKVRQIREKYLINDFTPWKLKKSFTNEEIVTYQENFEIDDEFLEEVDRAKRQDKCTEHLDISKMRWSVMCPACKKIVACDNDYDQFVEQLLLSKQGRKVLFECEL